MGHIIMEFFIRIHKRFDFLFCSKKRDKFITVSDYYGIIVK